MSDREEYILVNVNENMIKMLAREFIEKNDMCRCEKCFHDVCAIALNKFDAHYVTSRKGEAISRAMKSITENKVAMMIAVSQAVEIVKGQPMHDEQE